MFMLPNTEIFEFVSVSNRSCIFTAWNPKRGQFSFSLTIGVLSPKQFDCSYVSGTIFCWEHQRRYIFWSFDMNANWNMMSCNSYTHCVLRNTHWPPLFPSCWKKCALCEFILLPDLWELSQKTVTGIAKEIPKWRQRQREWAINLSFMEKSCKRSKSNPTCWSWICQLKATQSGLETTCLASLWVILKK